MFRSVASTLAWVGRTASMVFGLALVLALLFGVASMAFANDGQSFLLGARNVAQSVSTLVKQGTGPALDLQVDSGPPLKVNSSAKVARLNADKIDNLDSSALGVTMKTSMVRTSDCTAPDVWSACAPVTVKVPAGKQYHVTVWSSFSALNQTGVDNAAYYCPAIKGGSFGLSCITPNAAEGRPDLMWLPNNVNQSAASSGEIGPLQRAPTPLVSLSRYWVEG